MGKALERLGSPWQLTTWHEPDPITDEPEPHYLLTAPWCPRPPAREPAQLRDGPEFISLTELVEQENEQR